MPLPLYKEAEMRLEKETAIYQLGAIAADIDGATTLAKGKNKIFYQDTAPASGMNEGDLWFNVDSSGGSSLYEYKKTGSNPDTYAWTLRQLGQGSLVAGSVTANEISVNELSAISANLGSVNVGGANNQDGVITVLDAFGNPIGYWNNAGIDAQGTFKATNGNESCVMDSDTQGAYVSAKNSVSGIRMSANHDGSVGLYEVTPTSGGGGSTEVLWERTGTALNTEKTVTVGYLTSAPNNGVTIDVDGTISAKRTTGQALVYASNSSEGNRIFIYADGSNGQAGLYSYSADNTSRPILIRANNSNDITAYGEWTFNSGGIRSRNTSANAWIQAENGANVNAIAITSDSTGTVRLWSRSADGTTRTILQRANNSSDITAYGAWTFNTGIKGNNNYTGTPVLTETSGASRISYMASATGYVLRVNALWGGSTFATASATFTSSDIRLKKNIKDSTVEALPLVNSIKIREFDWKQDGKHQAIGMVADELEELDEDLAVGGGTNEDGTMNVKAVDTFYLVGYLTKAVQELSAKVEQLEKRIKVLEGGEPIVGVD